MGFLIVHCFSSTKLHITLFNCYQLLHANNINESASPEFIKLNMMVRENKQETNHNIIYVLFRAPCSFSLQWPLNNVVCRGNKISSIKMYMVNLPPPLSPNIISTK